MDLRPGDQVFGLSEDDVYKVVRPIGLGAFGIVYEVNDAQGNSFALKTIITAWLDAEALNALVNEGQLATEIKHENVLNVLYFHDGKQYPELPPYMLMEYADGGTLRDLLNQQEAREEHFASDQLRAILLQLARGMKAVSEKLVHRDIKPDNVLIINGVLKISDFGLSKVVGAATRSHTFKGIQHIKYCAPEGWRLDKNTPAMDMYSTGLVFYEIATLRHPYQVDATDNLIDRWRKAHLTQLPTDPRTYNPSLELSLAQAIMRMMSKRAEDRYSSWDEIIKCIENASEVSHIKPDIQSLVERAIESQKEKEQARLNTEERAREQKEYEDIIEYCFTEILNAGQETVEAFNSASETVKLRLDRSSRFSFSIHAEGQSGPGIEFRVVPVHDPHKLSGQNIKAWGFAKAPSGRGFNLVLTTGGEDDLYGRWRTLHVSHNPIAARRDPRPEPFPFELSELPKQVQLLDSLHIYCTRRGLFEPNLLNPLIEELL